MKEIHLLTIASETMKIARSLQTVNMMYFVYIVCVCVYFCNSTLTLNFLKFSVRDLNREVSF